MATGLLLIFLISLCHMTTAAVYSYNDLSEEIPYELNPAFLSGFRNIADKDFIIGGLFPVYDCTRSGLPNLELLEAMLFAIDQINNDMNLLPNLTIGYDVRDSCNDELIAIIEALGFSLGYNSSTPVFLGIVGPAYTDITHQVATLLSIDDIQIPMITYASSDVAFSNKELYEYLLRTIPSDSLQAHAMVDLIHHFGWEYVSVIFNDDDYGISASNAFADSVMECGICIDGQISIPLPEADDNIIVANVTQANITETNITETNMTQPNIIEAVDELLISTASVVAVFTNEATVLALFEELNKRNITRTFLWIASHTWANSDSVYTRFPEIANRTFGFHPHTDHIEEFDDYFSQLNPSTNIRNPFFHDPLYNGIYEHLYCSSEGSGGVVYCPDDLTAEPDYSQNDMVPHVIDAVYAFAHALQSFLDDNCDSPWYRYFQVCFGTNYEVIRVNGKNFLPYLHNVMFNGIQDHNVSFDKNGDPPGTYKINYFQANKSGYPEHISVGFWNSAYKENALVLNYSADGIEKIISRCSEPCSEGMIHSITNQNCPLCFECIPCVGPTYSMNSTAKNCSLCSDNHWGNNPLFGSTHCVPLKAQGFINGWSIAAMCFASITLIILAVVTVILVVNWNTPVVKSSGREQMIMLLVGIGVCCVSIYVMVSHSSFAVCIFQRIGVSLCCSLAFGALFVKIVRVARIFYSRNSVTKGPAFTKPKYQVMFTLAIVAGQLILVVIGLAVDPPAVKKDSNVIITTSVGQTGDTPEIVRVETCQQPHTAIMIFTLVYNFFLIIGCTILGWMTRKFPENFNEAKHVMFTSFSLMVVWVLFVPLYFSAETKLQIGILALGIVLSAIALLAGVFFPRVHIIVFEKHKNTKEYVSQQTHVAAVGMSPASFFKAFKQNVSRDSFMKPAAIPMSNHGKSPDKGTSTSDSGVVTSGDTVKEKHYQPESNMNSSCV